MTSPTLNDVLSPTPESATTSHTCGNAPLLLKIDDGWSGNKVAQEGLLQPRVPDTIYAWYHDWQDHGIAALYIEEGRGRKPAFSP